MTSLPCLWTTSGSHPGTSTERVSARRYAAPCASCFQSSFSKRIPLLSAMLRTSLIEAGLPQFSTTVSPGIMRSRSRSLSTPWGSRGRTVRSRATRAAASPPIRRNAGPPLLEGHPEQEAKHVVGAPGAEARTGRLGHPGAAHERNVAKVERARCLNGEELFVIGQLLQRAVGVEQCVANASRLPSPASWWSCLIMDANGARPVPVATMTTLRKSRARLSSVKSPTMRSTYPTLSSTSVRIWNSDSVRRPRSPTRPPRHHVQLQVAVPLRLERRRGNRVGVRHGPAPLHTALVQIRMKSTLRRTRLRASSGDSSRGGGQCTGPACSLGSARPPAA